MNPLQLTEHIESRIVQTSALVDQLFDRLAPVLINVKAQDPGEGEDDVGFPTESTLAHDLAGRAGHLDYVNARLRVLLSVIDLPDPEADMKKKAVPDDDIDDRKVRTSAKLVDPGRKSRSTKR